MDTRRRGKKCGRRRGYSANPMRRSATRRKQSRRANEKKLRPASQRFTGLPRSPESKYRRVDGAVEAVREEDDGAAVIDVASVLVHRFVQIRPRGQRHKQPDCRDTGGRGHDPEHPGKSLQ